MSPDLIFRLCNSIALLSWLLLIFAGFFTVRPARYVYSVVCQYIVPGLLSVAYLILILTHWAGHQGGFGSVFAVQKLFGNPWLTVAGWVHYLAFDLFIGAWQVRDAQRSTVPHWWIIPSLVLTFLFGPIGFLLYLLLKSVRSGSWRHTIETDQRS
jgi:hypothetical protein